MKEKRRKIDIYLDRFSDEQIDEIINIFKNIAVFTLHPDWITPEIKTKLHNRILESVERMENIEN